MHIIPMCSAFANNWSITFLQNGLGQFICLSSTTRYRTTADTVDGWRADQSSLDHVRMLRAGFKHNLVHIAMERVIWKCREFFDARPIVELAIGLLAEALFAGIKICEDACAACVQPETGPSGTVAFQNTGFDSFCSTLVVRCIRSIYAGQ